ESLRIDHCRKVRTRGSLQRLRGKMRRVRACDRRVRLIRVHEPEPLNVAFQGSVEPVQSGEILKEDAFIFNSKVIKGENLGEESPADSVSPLCQSRDHVFRS